MNMNQKILFITVFLFSILKINAQTEPIKISGYAQGTTYSITYYDKEKRDFKPEIDKLLKEFDHSVSLWDSTSVICRVNRNVPEVKLDKYFIDCFNKSQETSIGSNGAFDATVQPLVSIWGFSIKEKGKVTKQMIDSILQFVGYKKVTLKNGKIIKTDPRLKLDFDGIAQGYSVDVVSKFLSSKGITSSIVEIGGEVYGLNKKPNDKNWVVGIEKPIDNPDSANPLKAIVKIENKGMTTAGNYRKFYEENGMKYSHTIDPKTGYPCQNTLLSVTVLADDAFTADAWDTALMVMGLDNSIKYLLNHPELQAYLIYSDEKGNYKVYETSKIKELTTEVE